MSKKAFYELLIEELKDIYSAETQMVKALGRMAAAAHSEKLKDAFRYHLNQTKNHVLRLKQIAKILNEDLTGSRCNAMEGLIKESGKSLKMNYTSSVRDASLISEAQRIEHYEIAAYGTLRTFARHLKLDRVEELLNATIKEEGAADKMLTKIAEGSLFSTGVNTIATETSLKRKRVVRRRRGRAKRITA